MRVSSDAKGYAARAMADCKTGNVTVDAAWADRLATAFQSGMQYQKTRERSLTKLASGPVLKAVAALALSLALTGGIARANVVRERACWHPIVCDNTISTTTNNSIGFVYEPHDWFIPVVSVNGFAIGAWIDVSDAAGDDLQGPVAPISCCGALFIDSTIARTKGNVSNIPIGAPVVVIPTPPVNS
jgi:hypothetical protein